MKSPEKNLAQTHKSADRNTVAVWLCILSLFGLLTPSRAATYVSGPIVGQTWTSNGSPYYVNGNILVAGLTISNGVSIYFQGNYVFEVQGTLKAYGKTNSPVVFYRPGTAGWQGIFFNYSNPGSELYCCVISNSINSGVRILDSAPYLENCTIAYNSATSGGGISVDNAEDDLTLRNCTIANNQASYYGGGIYALMHTNRLKLLRCWIRGNIANPAGSEGSYLGGGLAVAGNSLLRNCVVSGNTVSGCAGSFNDRYSDGGGIWSDTGLVELYNCTVTNNLAQNWSAGSFNTPRAYGGGLEVYSGSLIAANCIFAYNTASGGAVSYGGGICCSPSGTVKNCTFAYNNPEGLNAASTLVVMNSILYFNAGGGTQVSGPTSVTYCDVQNGFAGTGNINYGPIFLSANNLTIVAGSRCVDAGNPASAYNDTCFSGTNPTFSLGTQRNDIGAHGGPGAWGWVQGDEPRIATQPQSQSSCLGQGITFQVLAAGSDPLGYQWYFKGAPLTGKTSTNLTVSPLQKTDAGAYWVVVSNVFGSVTSAPAQLTVFDACIDLQMYAGLSIAGQQGSSYVLSYSTDLGNPNSWVPMATNTMGAAGWFYLDMNSPFSPHRFYKATLR